MMWKSIIFRVRDDDLKSETYVITGLSYDNLISVHVNGETIMAEDLREF